MISLISAALQVPCLDHLPAMILMTQITVSLEQDYCMNLFIIQERVEALLHTGSYVAPKLVFILIAQKIRCSRALWSLQSINEAF